MDPKIWSTMDKRFCHLGPFSALLPSNNQKRQNFEKLKKNPGRYHHFTPVYQKL